MDELFGPAGFVDAFRAVNLEEGIHTVEFIYKPGSRSLGIVASGFSFGLLLLWVGFALAACSDDGEPPKPTPDGGADAVAGDGDVVIQKSDDFHVAARQADLFLRLPERSILGSGVRCLQATPGKTDLSRMMGQVVDGTVTHDLEWLSANEEEEARIAQANAPLNEDGTFKNEFVLCRERGDFPLLRPEDIDYMDVAPDQLVSVAAALIPFLENDDANRALMGSNMQRQAVPLVRAEAPYVGTGMEAVVARDSGAAIGARRTGTVDQVDPTSFDDT